MECVVRRGMSLTEVIISFFLLLTACLLVIRLFHSGFRHFQTTQRQAMATRLAEKVLDEVRAWAREPANFRSGWSTYRGVTRTDPDYSGLVARVDCDPAGRVVYSPCSSVEASMAPDSRQLDTSIVPVRVSVDWGGNRPVTLMAYCPEPPRTAARVVVRRTGGPADPVPRDAMLDFTAELRDADDLPIMDVTFRWYVDPVAPGLGNATVDPSTSRDGRQGRIRHWCGDDLLGRPIYRPGTIRVRARAVYRGAEIWGESEPILLQ
ncbi:MAG: hypothetical protein AB1758_05305 [Candidatus Eremiobacterota bacterium]